jgi:uncharacterized protein
VSAVDVAGAAVVGFCAGVSSGALGIGGGILFVPALVSLLGMSQLRAESTSLLAIIPVAALGALRQYRYGNLRIRDGVVVGLLSPIGVGIGTAVANVVPERPLKLAFAAMLLVFAFGLVRRALRPAPKAAGGSGRG